MYEDGLAGGRYGLGAGATYVGKRAGNSIDSFELPSYTTMRAMAYWKPSKTLRFSLDIDNLFDKTYYASSYDVYWVTPGRAPHRDPGHAGQVLMPGGNQRINAIDALRGLVMALMVVDHVREFFFPAPAGRRPDGPAHHLARAVFPPASPATSAPRSSFFSPGLAPGATDNGTLAPSDDPRRAASAFLAKRWPLPGAELELSLINFAWTFAFPPRMLYLQVIWAIGLSMLALAALLWLPRAGQLVLGLLIIVGHNLLDSLHFPPGTAAHAVWAVLHDPRHHRAGPRTGGPHLLPGPALDRRHPAGLRAGALVCPGQCAGAAPAPPCPGGPGRPRPVHTCCGGWMATGTIPWPAPERAWPPSWTG